MSRDVSKRILKVTVVILACVLALLVPGPFHTTDEIGGDGKIPSKGTSGSNIDIGDRPPLLLGAQLGPSRQADVKVVVWFPEADQAAAASLLPAEWDWKVRTDARAQAPKAFSAVSARTIGEAEEAGLLSWYLSLAAKVKAMNGQVYLEERVHEGVDIQRYFALVGAEPLQWARTGATTSLTGYRSGYGEPVKAGPDSVNLQVLSRMNERGGETLLALPVLLTEF